jgi:cobaltochelatase CobN
VEAIPAAELGRPPIDVVVRISGFFRDAFPHLVALLDDAVTLAGFDDGDPRIFGAKPGAYGSGILPLLDSRDWRTDDDLAAVYLAWGGYSYGRGGMGVPAVDAMRRRLATVEVAVKNQDNREHDIFDSDDYLQDHGGMVATIRALTGAEPKAWFGDSSNPSRPRVRSLAEEAARVVRTRVLNPKWIDAMTRHGYKGAFELAATVDYLFGYDATAHVVEDWMYERVTEAYVGDPTIRKFLEQSNPWALTSMAERLLEAEQRGLWHASDAALSTLRDALLEAEGWEEGR